jgi:hypothetical protein
VAFPIKCGDCKKSFSISDEVYNRKVRGKLVTIKCKSCGSAIRVDGTKPKPSSRPAPAKDASNEETKPKSAPTETASEAKAPAAAKPTSTADASATTTPQQTKAAAEPKPAAKISPAQPQPKPLGKGLISSPTKPQVTRRPLTAEKQAAPPGKSSPFAASAGENELTPKPNPTKTASGTKQASSSPFASRPKAPAPKPTDSSDNILWAVDYGESEHHELTTAEIEQEIKKGNIDGQTLVWHDNMPDWLAILDVKELRGFAEGNASNRKSRPSTAKPPVPKSSPRAGALKGLPSAPKAAPPPPLGPLSSRPPPAPSPPKPATSHPPLPPLKKPKADQDEVVTSARLIDEPPPPSSAHPFADMKGLGAAPSTAGLAGATSAPAGGPPPMPQVAAAAASGGLGAAGFPLPSSGGSPFAASSASPVPEIAPAAAPLALPTANATNPAAAMPAAAMPPPMPVAVTGLSDDIDWPQARSKKPLVFGALGVTALVVVAWLLLGGSDEQPTPSAPHTPAATAVAPPSEPTLAATPEPEPEPTTTATDQPAAPSPKGEDFADIFEQSAKGSK